MNKPTNYLLWAAKGVTTVSYATILYITRQQWIPVQFSLLGRRSNPA